MIKLQHLGTLTHTVPYFKFISQANNSNIYPPTNKKCSPWKDFGINHPPTLQLLSRRGSKSLDARLSQHYIGKKMTFCHFSNFCRKKFSSLTKKLLHISIQIWGLKFAKTMWLDLYNHSISAENFFCQAWKFFSAEIWKCWNIIFGWCNVEMVPCLGF